MFAYCNNTPTSLEDHGGNIPVAIGIPVGVLITAAKAAATAAAVVVGIAVAKKSSEQRQKKHTTVLSVQMYRGHSGSVSTRLFSRCLGVST